MYFGGTSMNISILKSLMFSAICLSLSMLPTMPAQAQITSLPKTVTLHATDIPLIRIIEQIHQQTGADIQLSKRIDPFEKVTVSLTNLSVTDAMEVLESQLDCTLAYPPNGNGNYMLFPSSDKAVIQPGPQQVQMNVEFIQAEADTVDALGIDFHFVPTSDSTTAQMATGLQAQQLYRKIVSQKSVTILQAPLLTESTDAPAMADWTLIVPYINSHQSAAYPVDTPQHRVLLFLDRPLTIWPHLDSRNSPGTVTLALEPTLSCVGTVSDALSLPVSPLLLENVPSGQMVIVRLPVPDSKFSVPPVKPDTLLIAITPTMQDAYQPSIPVFPAPLQRPPASIWLLNDQMH
jgi:hypothetical protein